MLINFDWSLVSLSWATFSPRWSCFPTTNGRESLKQLWINKQRYGQFIPLTLYWSWWWGWGKHHKIVCDKKKKVKTISWGEDKVWGLAVGAGGRGDEQSKQPGSLTNLNKCKKTPALKSGSTAEQRNLKNPQTHKRRLLPNFFQLWVRYAEIELN